MGELKATRDSARADTDRAENRTGDDEARITPEKLQQFAGETKRRLRKADGAYRRHHIQALAQRVEVGLDEIRSTGSRAKLLGTLADAGLASPGVLTARTEVRSFVPNWLPNMPVPMNYFGIWSAKGTPEPVVKTMQMVWEKKMANSEALKKYATQRAALFNPMAGADAEREAMKMVRHTAWLYFDAGKAKVSPETVGIQRLQ